MKLRLPSKLVAAIMAAASPVLFTTIGSATFGETAAATETTTLGNVMYIGDSITNGHGGMVSWRWQFFKMLTDNGISQTEQGINTGRHNNAYHTQLFTNQTYGGQLFENIHSGYSSGRAWEISGRRSDGSRYDGTNIKNWLGVSNTNNWGQTYNGTVYSAENGNAIDNFFLLIGTNDLLSDAGYSETQFNNKYNNLLGYDAATDTLTHAETADIEVIYNTMKAQAPSAGIVMLTIPTTGTNSTNVCSPETVSGIMKYNELLTRWVADKNAAGGNIKLIDVNKGLIDVTDSVPTQTGGANSALVHQSGVAAFFNDGLHPSAQGELIIAVNVAKGMGIGGRTAGLVRSSAATDGEHWTLAPETSYTLSSGTQDIATDIFSATNGYTVDFGAVFGNGAEEGWLASSNALTVTIGDGSHTGTLNMSEGYIMWDGNILYSQDNHANTDNIRIAYHNGSAAENVAGGYYVWLGDMLIGEGLTATTGSGLLNGITLGATGAAGTVSNLSWANTAYAPTTTGTYNSSTAFLAATADSTNNTAQGIKTDVSWTELGAVGYVVPSGTASATTHLSKEITGTSGRIYTGGINANYAGDVDVKYNGTANAEIGALGAFGGTGHVTLDGNLYMEFDSTGTFGQWTSVEANGPASVVGAYNATVNGDVTLVLNNGSFTASIYGGAHTGAYDISGATNVYVNGGTIAGSVYGGSRVNNTIGGASLVTVTGGVIEGSVYGGGTGGTINGGTTVTVTGGVIRGNVFGGMSNETAGAYTGDVTIESNHASIAGSINANNVTLKDVEDGNYTSGFDRYHGAINATTKLTLDGYTAAHLNAAITTQGVLLTHNSQTTISNLHLTACDITAEEGSSLTLEGNLTLGNTATYSGDISIANGITISMSSAAFAAAEVTDTFYSAGVSGFRTQGSAVLTSSDTSRLKSAASGAELTAANALTFVGADGLAGASFFYNAETGTLSAGNASGTTYYVNDKVVYNTDTPAYAASDFVINDGGNLQLDTNLKSGVTIAGADGSTSSMITVDNGVTLAKNSVSGTIATYAVNDGGTYSYGNYGNTDDASRLDYSTSLTGAGTMQVKFTGSGHGGAYVMTGEDFSGTLDLSGKVHLQDLNTNTANAAVKYYIHDADIWWGNADITVAHNITLGGNINYRPEGNTTFSGVLTDDGSENFNWQLGGGAGNNNQKGKTITLTNAGASSLSKVTLVNDNLKLQGVQGSGNDRLLFTGNVVVNAGRELTLWPGSANSSLVGDAAEVRGTVTLNGTSSSVAKITFQDGSVHITEAVDLGNGGYGEIDNSWGKQQYVQSFKGLNATLTLDRKTGDDGNGGYFNVMENGAFSGTIKLISRAGDESGGLILHDSGAALANTVVDFTGASDSEKSLLAFISGNGSFDNNNKKLTTTTFTDGVVAGIKGDKGSIKAGTFTINMSEDNTYGGNISVNKLVVNGEGTLTLATKGVLIDNQRIVNEQGTGEAGGSAAFAKIFQGSAVQLGDNAKLVLDGNVALNSSIAPAAMGLKELEITGFVNLNSQTNGATWNVGSNSLSVGSYLWLTNKQNMLVGPGGSLSVGGELILSHQQNDDAGQYKVTVETNGATFSAAAIGLSGGGNKLLLNNSKVTFTRTAENAATNLLANAHNTVGAGNSNTTISLSGNTLNSGDNGWNLTAIDGVTLTVDGATKLNIADGKTITIGGAQVAGSFTHLSGSTGTLELADATLAPTTLDGGKFTLNGATTFNGSLQISNGTLALGDGATAQINKGTDMNRYVLKGTGEGGTGTPTYSGTGAYEGSGYLQGTATYYLINRGEGGSVTGSFTSVTGEGVTYNNDLTFMVEGADTSTYYVNGNVAYDATMDGATYLNIADGKTLTATANPTAAKTLLGSGTYHFKHANAKPNITLGEGDNWTGTVVLDGLNLWTNRTNLNALGNANSWVKLTGTTSIDNNWNNSNTINANLILEDTESGASAWKINEGTVQNTMTYTFTGAIKGDGTLEKASNKRQNFTFTGDISEWTGALILSQVPSNDTNPKVTFKGQATDINTAIKRTDKTAGTTFEVVLTEPAVKLQPFYLNNTIDVDKLTATGQNVVLGRTPVLGADDAKPTFTVSGAVAVNKLTVAEGMTATIGSLSTTQVSTVEKDATLTVTTAQSNAGIKALLATAMDGAGTLNFSSNQTGTSFDDSKDQFQAGGVQHNLGVDHVNLTGNLGLNNWTSNSAKGGLTIGEGKHLTVDGNVRVETNFDLNVEGGELTVTGTLGLGHTAATAAHVTIGDGSVVTLGGLAINNTSADSKTFDITGGTLDFSKDGNVFSDADASKTAATFSLLGGTLQAKDHSWTFNHAAKLGDMTMNSVGESTNMTISGVLSDATGEHGAITKTGDGTLTLSAVNTFTGDLVVEAGTLKIGDRQALGAYNTDDSRAIIIKSGATLDINGLNGNESSYAVTLNGGTLTNSVANSTTGESQRQVVTKLKVTDNSFVDAGASKNFGLIGAQYAPTTVALGANNLTKTGAGTYFMTNTTVTGTGALVVQEGTLDLRDGNNRQGSLQSDVNLTGGTLASSNGKIHLGSNISIKATALPENPAANANKVTGAIDLGANALTVGGTEALTLSGVISGTGSLVKTDANTVTLTAANTFTGGTTIQHGTLVGANSNALQSSVVTFSDVAEDRVLSFENNGSAINGTIAGLSGYRGTVVADTLTINVAQGGNYQFLHRYSNGTTNDAAVLDVNKLVKTGAGTQVIGGEYTAARGFAEGLVIANGIDVQQGTLHMKTRGTVKSNISVAAGATFKTSDDDGLALTAADAMHYNGKMTLNGTASNTATLNYADGSTYIENGLEVNGYGKVIMEWDKTQFIGGFYSAGSTPSVLTLERASHAVQNPYPRYIVVDKSGNFSGTIKMNNKAGADSFGIVAAGANAEQSLAGAVVDFTDTTNNAMVAFVTTTSTNRPNTSTRIDDFNTYKGDYLTAENMRDGAVAGLKGDKGDIYAKNLTINTANETSYDFGGSLNVSGLVKAGNGTQTLSKENVTLGTLTMQAGTLNLTNGATITGLNMSGTTTVTNGGTLNLSGAGVLTDMTASSENDGYSDGANGFEAHFTNYNVITNTGSGTVNSTVTDWTVNGNEVNATMNADGSLTAVYKATDGIYYVNEAMTFSNASTTADREAATTFNVKADTTFTTQNNKLSGKNVVLNDGATLHNRTQVYFDRDQIHEMTLEGDATANVENRFALVNKPSGYGDTSLNLKGHTLTVVGTGDDENRFGLYNTTVTAGTIALNAAKLQLGHSGQKSTVNAEDTLITFEGTGASIELEGNSDLTVEGLSGTGAVSQNGGSLTIDAGNDAEHAYDFSGSLSQISLTMKGTGYQNIAVTNTNGATLNSLNLQGSATLNLTGGSVTANSFSATEDNHLGISGGAALTVLANEAETMSHVTLNSGSLNLYSSGQVARTFTLNSLEVTGTGNTIDAANGGYHGQVEINNLSSTAAGADLTLAANAVVDRASVFNINSGEAGAFDGTLHLKQGVASDHTDGRHVAMNIKDADVLSNAVISMEAASTDTSRVALGVAVDGATVKGISTADEYGQKIIFSGAADLGAQSYESDDTVRTLVINTAGGDYTANATIKRHLNLTKDGAGTQNFSGNVTAFNGKIEVNDGTLAFTELNESNKLVIGGVTTDEQGVEVDKSATVNDNGSLKAGRATLTAKDALSRTATHTGTVSNAVFAANSLSGVKDETHNGGTLVGSLLEIAEKTTYTISDMTLTNSVVDATAEGAVLNMQNVSIDADSSVAANSGALTGSNRLTLSNTVEVVHPNANLQSAQLSGLTLQSEANLAITLSNTIGSDLTNGAGFTITLSGFQWEALVNPSAEPAFTLESLNETFTVTAMVNGNQVNFDVINAQMIAATGSAPVALKLTVVPEPTTGVLSLLALAGMAARRRRK